MVLAATMVVVACQQAISDVAKAETAEIGELALPYDPGTWRIMGESDEPSISIAKDDPNNRYGVDVSIAAGPSAGCSADSVLERAALAYPQAWERSVATIARPGFDLHVATLDMGCRNLAGSPVFACVAYREKLYSFTADPGGCRWTGHGYDGMVIDLLGGLREQ